MMDEAKIQALKQEHGEVQLLTHRGCQVVIRIPNRQEWKRFRASSIDDRKRADALEVLLLDAAVYPSRDDVSAMVDRLPGLAETFGSAIVQFAGVDKDVEKKEL